MKVAFTEWRGRVAPVFDVAQTVLMVETETSDNTRERLMDLPPGSPSTKVLFLTEQNVDVLVCGAISRPVREMAKANHILVHSFVAGDIQDVVDAWMHDRLDQARYSMPGCRRQRSGKNDHQEGGNSCHVEIKQGRKEQAP